MACAGRGQQRRLPQAASISTGAQQAKASVAGWKGNGGREGHCGGVRQGRSKHAPAIRCGTGSDGLGHVDPGIHRDVHGVRVVGIDKDGVGGRIGQIRADVKPRAAKGRGAVEMRNAEAHHRCVHGRARSIVGIDRDGRNIVVLRVEDMGIRGIVGDRGHGDVRPCLGARRSACALGYEQVSGDRPAAVLRSGDACVDHGRARVLRVRGGYAGATSGDGSDQRAVR